MNIDYEVIGFLWGSARFSGDYFIVQSVHKHWLDRTKKVLGLSNIVFSSLVSKGNTQTWRLKIPASNRYITWMLENNYIGRLDRNEEQSYLPTFETVEDQKAFYCGYFAVHYTLDYPKGKARIRFYAANDILLGLTNHLNAELGVGIKKIQGATQSNVCKILHYQSPTEVALILDYFKWGFADKDHTSL
jgi:hypothetical protein